MTDHCGTATVDGNAVCIPGECSCSQKAETSTPVSAPISNQNVQKTSTWKKTRSGVMFGIACIASPCCTPIIVPIMIALLAGTPIAIWLTAHAGLVYGGLTLLSIVSLVLAIHWMGKFKEEPDNKNVTLSTAKGLPASGHTSAAIPYGDLRAAGFLGRSAPSE